MTARPAASAPAYWPPSDRYSGLLAFSLAGYALLGKGYAYAGVAPVFITEVVLAFGVLIILHTRCVAAALSTVPMMMLASLIVLGVSRAIPYVSSYGVDALRDSVIVVYAIFAVIVVSLLLERPERLASALRFLEWLTGVFVFIAPVAYLTNRVSFLSTVPGWPAAGFPLVFTKGGDFGVHLSACAVMALLGLRSARPAWCAALLADACLVTAQNRGGMLSIIVPVAFAVVIARRWRPAGAIVIGGFAMICAIYVTNFDLPIQDMNSRPVNGQQVVENIASVFLPSSAGNLDGTKAWRLIWWQKIENYTLHGPYFWSGKGFGINIAVADGFEGADSGAPLLRSPHNSHLNVLARLGVPGFTLWCLLGASWLLLMLRHVFLAWRLGCKSWGDVMLFIVCYWLAIVIDASFDVAIEGPMIGVWFWCLFGFGVGTVMLFQSGAAESGSRDELTTIERSDDAVYSGRWRASSLS